MLKNMISIYIHTHTYTYVDPVRTNIYIYCFEQGGSLLGLPCLDCIYWGNDRDPLLKNISEPGGIL